MLARRKRLPRSGFAALSRARRTESKHFSLSFSRVPVGRGGCAVVVSKKVAASSVARHLVKRRMLAVMEPWCTGSVALVAYAKAGSAALSFPRLSEEFSGLLATLTGFGHSS